MTPEDWIFIGAIIFHGFLVVIIIAEVWDPFHVGRRVKDLEDAVKRVWQIRCYIDLYVYLHFDLDPLDRLFSSQRWKGWLRRMRDLQDKAEKIMAGHKGCVRLNYLSKCYYGKKAGKLLKKATDLVETGEALLKEALARPRPARDVLPRHPRNQLRGMDSYKQEVLHFIMDRSSRSGLLGICGMRGVGKTSLLELVRDSFAEYALLCDFDHFLFIQAGRGATVCKTQQAISATLGLPFMPDEGSQEEIIYNHLRDKSFLLLIDDLRWYDLTHVQRLPLDHGGGVVHKIVFTTSSDDVYHQMDYCGRRQMDYYGRQMDCTVFRTILLKCLSKDDAWKVFEDKLGKEIIDDDDRYNFGYLAKELVYECHGLPLALCTIAQAMSTKKDDTQEWRRAIHLLVKLKLRSTIIMSDDNLHSYLYHLTNHEVIIENDDLKELRKVTDLVDTNDEHQLLKAVLALRVMLTPVSKDRIVSYIRLKEINLPSRYGMASYEMKVLSFAEGKSCSLLGIWGVRGVGKTTLLRFVQDYAHDFLSYYVFFVGAGKRCTVHTLQHALCFNIGLDPPPPHISDVSLAQLISISLKDIPFLLLVDDVHERLDLAALGVPMPLRHNQKVIFTTRNKEICTEKGSCTIPTSIIHMECLGKADAWNLFNDKVGNKIIDDHPQIRHLAEKMVAKCLGLPSVLCTLGRAMSTKRDVNEWRYAYDVLSKKPPHVDKIQEMDDERYSHLHHLEDALLKHSFF